MSTTKQLKVYKGIPTIIKARAQGYWDEETMLVFNTNAENQNVTMDVYDGLSYDIASSASGVKVLDFVNTVLPYKWDYNSELTTSKYCLAPSGQNYNVAYYTYNFIVNGTPTIDYSTGIISNFSTSNYLQLPQPFGPQTNTWEIVFKVTTGSDVSGGAVFGNFGGSHQNAPQIGLSSGKFVVYMPGSSTNSQQFNRTGTYNVQANTTYWLKLYFTGSSYNLKYSLDGTNYTNDIYYSSSMTIFTPSAGFNIGYNYFSSSSDDVWKGSIDLWESYIKINGVLWWEGRVENIESLPGILYNYTDDGSAVTLNCFANGDTSVILTPDNDYNGTYLGTVNIPAHLLYIYNPNTGNWILVPQPEPNT